MSGTSRVSCFQKLLLNKNSLKSLFLLSHAFDANFAETISDIQLTSPTIASSVLDGIRTFH